MSRNRSIVVAIACCFAVASAGCLDSETHWGDNQPAQTGGQDAGQEGNDDETDDNNGDIGEPTEGGLGAPMQVVFPDTEPGNSSVETIEFTNREDDTIGIDGVTIEDDVFTTDEFPDEWPQEVDAGDIFEIEATYTPDDHGEDVEELVVEWTHDGDQEETTVQLVGNQPCLIADVDSLDFRDIDVGETGTRTVEIENCGEASIDVDATIAFEGAALDTNPLAVEDAGDFPVALDAAASTDVVIEFTPDREYTAGGGDGEDSMGDPEAFLVFSSPDTVMPALTMVQLYYR